MLDDLFVHWQPIVFIATVAVFFVMWRSDSNRHADTQKQRDEAILKAITDVASVVQESRRQAQDEHKSLAQLFERLDEHTVTEHRLLEKSLGQLSTSLEYHIADERSKR